MSKASMEVKINVDSAAFNIIVDKFNELDVALASICERIDVIENKLQELKNEPPKEP